MKTKQREALVDLQNRIGDAADALERLRRKADRLQALFPTQRAADDDFSPEDIDRLVRLNARLGFLQAYLHRVDQAVCAQMRARIADPDDPLDDFEIDVTLSFMRREDDPEIDDDSDNFLTTRQTSMKGFDTDAPRLDEDFRETIRRFPGRLNTIPHCWLFHDLYDHSYGLSQPALSLSDCLRIGQIWVDIGVRHQATLDIDSGEWQPPEALS